MCSCSSDSIKKQPSRPSLEMTRVSRTAIAVAVAVSVAFAVTAAVVLLSVAAANDLFSLAVAVVLDWSPCADPSLPVPCSRVCSISDLLLVPNKRPIKP